MSSNHEAGQAPGFSWRRRVRAGIAAVGAIAASAALAMGCLDRPVVAQEPNTSNIFVAELQQNGVDKIDLLFMIDNSISMADKQEILREAVPVLVQRLVTPICLGPDEAPNGQNAGIDGECERGTPEFTAVKDIHIAVITSSLGAHGGDYCLANVPGLTGFGNQTENDRAYPLGKVRPLNPLPNGPADWAGTGFLAWDPDAAERRPRNSPAGVSDPELLVAQFQNMVRESGENGCGYEASLEAWYRFLVDPDPPTNVFKDPQSGNLTAQYPDPTLLELRARFLRSDSLVAIIMLSDENDCSIADEGIGWYVGLNTEKGHLPRSTSVCAKEPNSPCCFSCSVAGPPECTQPAADPSCSTNGGVYTSKEDHQNLRCYKQRERFGADLLYPISRYVDALTKDTVRGRDNTIKPNPLIHARRDKSLVFLAGIVGVPWQDVATKESLPPNAPLKYMTYKELVEEGRFDWILGTPGRPPRDALMFETTADRTKLSFLDQTHPATGQPLAPAAATPSPGANAINGREFTVHEGDDLQYACIFPLGETKDCARSQGDCDCSPPPRDPSDPQAPPKNNDRPLCNGTTQTHAKAYPGTRHLEVLKGVGEQSENAIIASICPKFTDRSQGTSYGYTPAVSAIIERLKIQLRGKCLPRKLVTCTCDPRVDPTCGTRETDRPCTPETVPGQVSCSVIEATLPDANGQCGACEPETMPGRVAAPDSVRDAVETQLRKSGRCGSPGSGKPACESFCLCKIQQHRDDALRRCQTEPATPANIHGYCYVDPAEAQNADAKAAASTLVENCPNTQRRLLRFTGEDVPAKGAVAFIACLGGNVQEVQPATETP
ncbi:MAG TPA: hypothetical protein VIM73_06355 [Polyangiaceae bacterium]